MLLIFTIKVAFQRRNDADLGCFGGVNMVAT